MRKQGSLVVAIHCCIISKSLTHIEMCHQFLDDENERIPQTFQGNGDGNSNSDSNGNGNGVVYHCNVKLIINYVSF